MALQKEPGFRESVNLMFNRAVALMDLSPGLEEKIRVCNATYTVRAIAPSTPSTWSR